MVSGGEHRHCAQLRSLSGGVPQYPRERGLSLQFDRPADPVIYMIGRSEKQSGQKIDGIKLGVVSDIPWGFRGMVIA